MDTAIILGFEYPDTDDSLKATIVDMYRVYKFCEHLKTNEIYILTDCKHQTEYYKLEKEMQSFKPNNQKYKWINIETLDDLCLTLIKINIGSRALIYYTGHGENGIKLPSHEIIEFGHYRDLFLSRCLQPSQIIWILDCCTASSFPLPYQLDGTKFLNINDGLVYHDIICFISSDHMSPAGMYYSYYTKYIIRKLYDRSLSLIDINDCVSKCIGERTNEQCYVYSSHNRTPVLWIWIINDKLNINLCQTGLIINCK